MEMISQQDASSQLDSVGLSEMTRLIDCDGGLLVIGRQIALTEIELFMLIIELSLS